MFTSEIFPQVGDLWRAAATDNWWRPGAPHAGATLSAVNIELLVVTEEHKYVRGELAAVLPV